MQPIKSLCTEPLLLTITEKKHRRAFSIFYLFDPLILHHHFNPDYMHAALYMNFSNANDSTKYGKIHEAMQKNCDKGLALSNQNNG